ncbi:hypothetical protein ACFLYL_04345 [Chloroflexota bacterium]
MLFGITVSLCPKLIIEVFLVADRSTDLGLCLNTGTISQAFTGVGTVTGVRTISSVGAVTGVGTITGVGVVTVVRIVSVIGGFRYSDTCYRDYHYNC